MTESTHRRTEQRPTGGRAPGEDRGRTRAARYPHAPERVPDRAGRFLGLLDRSRRDDGPSPA